MNALRDLNQEIARRAVSLSPPGTTLTRAALALARTPHLMGAIENAQASWGPSSGAARVLQAKAAIAAGSTQPGNWAASTAEHRIAQAEFVAALRPMTVLGRMTGYRRVPQQVKIPRMTAGATVGWVGEARPAPVTSIAADTVSLDNFKIGSIIVTTSELVKFSSPDVDGLVRADLLAAVASMIDRALLDPAAAAVAGVSPASITNGAVQIPSSGSTLSALQTDLAALFNELTSNGILLTAPWFIMAPQTAVKLALLSTGSGFINLGTRADASLASVPVITSGSIASSVIVLLDAAELLVADSDEISLDLSQHASIQLNTTPDFPSTAATVSTSLFHANLIGWRVTKPLNFMMRRAHAVASITGIA